MLIHQSIMIRFLYHHAIIFFKTYLVGINLLNDDVVNLISVFGQNRLRLWFDWNRNQSFWRSHKNTFGTVFLHEKNYIPYWNFVSINGFYYFIYSLVSNVKFSSQFRSKKKYAYKLYTLIFSELVNRVCTHSTAKNVLCAWIKIGHGYNSILLKSRSKEIFDK